MKCSDSPFCECLYFSSNALARKTEKLAQQSWAKVDLSPSHAYLLMRVLANPGVQPGALSEQMLLQPSTITRLIEKLEDRKLLTRINQGKQTSVYPTPKAKELQPTLEECLEHFYKGYSSILGKEESAKLVRQMNVITDKL